MLLLLYQYKRMRNLGILSRKLLRGDMMSSWRSLRRLSKLPVSSLLVNLKRTSNELSQRSVVPTFMNFSVCSSSWTIYSHRCKLFITCHQAASSLSSKNCSWCIWMVLLKRSEKHLGLCLTWSNGLKPPSHLTFRKYSAQSMLWIWVMMSSSIWLVVKVSLMWAISWLSTKLSTRLWTLYLSWSRFCTNTSRWSGSSERSAMKQVLNCLSWLTSSTHKCSSSFWAKKLTTTGH